jgi:CO/xanthine dehydrogenase Mo-binding subunit
MVVTQSAEKVIKQLCSRAAKIWKIDEDAVTWDNGYARPAGDNAGKFEPLSLAQIAAKASETGGPIGAGTQLNTAGAEGGFSTHVADVEVDPATGKIKVIRMTCFQDVGRAIHPDYVEGQIQGGMAQAIGWALTEEYIYNKRGQVDNPGFLDYRMPVASDLPMLECGIIEIPNPKHPQGVKGVGEVPLVPGMAAIRNAVYGAIGIRFNHLPMSPPKVLEALEPEPLRQAAD